MSAPTQDAVFPVSSIAVQRNVALKPNSDTLAFSFAFDNTADDESIYQLMDTVSRVVDREKLKSDLSERRAALKVALQQPAMLRKEIDRLRIQRAALYAGQQARAQTSGRREFRQTDKQKADIEKYDAEIAAAEGSIKTFVRDVKIIEWECAKLEAQIAGKPEPEPPAEVEAAIEDMREAAE